MCGVKVQCDTRLARRAKQPSRGRRVYEYLNARIHAHKLISTLMHADLCASVYLYRLKPAVHTFRATLNYNLLNAHSFKIQFVCCDTAHKTFNAFKKTFVRNPCSSYYIIYIYHIKFTQRFKIIMRPLQ